MSTGDITAEVNGQNIGRSKEMIVRRENEDGDSVAIARGTLEDIRMKWIIEGIQAGVEHAEKVSRVWATFYSESGEQFIASGAKTCAESIASIKASNIFANVFTNPHSNS